MLSTRDMDLLGRLAKGVAAQFGPDCEVVVHDLTGDNLGSTVAIIENGGVTGRKPGDGPSRAVLETLRGEAPPEDRLCYLTKTADGRILRSSTICLRDEAGTVVGLFAINYDISLLLAVEERLRGLTGVVDAGAEPARIPQNVSELLNDLIEQSVRLIGKPAALMSKEDKVRAIRFLSDTGAFLITKSGDRVAKYFGISKYTLYSYMDESRASEA